MSGQLHPTATLTLWKEALVILIGHKAGLVHESFKAHRKIIKSPASLTGIEQRLLGLSVRTLLLQNQYNSWRRGPTTV
jgi:hypothetical protein